MPLDNGLLHIHKCQKVTNVYCLLSQRTTRQLKFKTNVDGTLEPDTQSAFADNNFYKTSDYLLQKRENPSKTHLWAIKYNLKEIMERDHKSHMGSPCHSVFILPLFWCASTKILRCQRQLNWNIRCLQCFSFSMTYEVTTAAKCRSLIPSYTSEWLSSLFLFL